MPDLQSDASAPGFGAEEREMLRASLREFLADRWIADKTSISEVWSGLLDLGLGGLAENAESGGMREIVIAMEEMGRAACPAPTLGATLINLIGRCAYPLSRPPREARIGLAFAAADLDRGAGSVRYADGRAQGEVRYVEGAEGATHVLLACLEPCGFVAGAVDGATVAVTPTRAVGAGGLGDVVLKDATAVFIPLERAALDDMRLLAGLARIARAYGAARLRHGGPICRGTQAVRSADRAISGHSAQARQRTDCAGRRAARAPERGERL